MVICTQCQAPIEPEPRDGVKLHTTMYACYEAVVRERDQLREWKDSAMNVHARTIAALDAAEIGEVGDSSADRIEKLAADYRRLTKMYVDATAVEGCTFKNSKRPTPP